MAEPATPERNDDEGSNDEKLLKHSPESENADLEMEIAFQDLVLEYCLVMGEEMMLRIIVCWFAMTESGVSVLLSKLYSGLFFPHTSVDRSYLFTGVLPMASLFRLLLDSRIVSCTYRNIG